MQLKFKKSSDKAIIPKYQTIGSSGFDFHAVVDENNLPKSAVRLGLGGLLSPYGDTPQIVIPPGEQRIIDTGLSVEIPPGFEIQVRPRSGLAAKHCITVTNSPGTIDCDYSGHIRVILFNLGDKPFVIKNGDRVAQGVVQKVEQMEIVEVSEIRDTERGVGGFGSTGV
jgi:dUTP pyrophosphatase